LLTTSFLVSTQASAVYYSSPRYYSYYPGSYYGFTYNSPSTYLHFGYNNYNYQPYYRPHSYYTYHNTPTSTAPHQCYMVNGYLRC